MTETVISNKEKTKKSKIKQSKQENSKAIGKNKGKNKGLWTRDFTIITIGSVISMLGNSLVGFAMSLMVLDYTSSSMLYAIYIVTFTLPQLVLPIVSGAILDRFSRKKMIYTLDFISAGIYLTMAILLWRGVFNFVLFAVICFVLGAINSTYMVAYDSFYPLLIPKGYYQKAYSISGMLETMTAVMVPVATVIYNKIGIAPLMILNAVTFLAAAIFETQISQTEEYIEKQANETKRLMAGENDTEKSASIKRTLGDIKEGLKYLKSEKGLLAITCYFFFSMMVSGSENVIALPFYKNHFTNGEYIFILVTGMMLFGRVVGGGVHYKTKIPPRYKYRLAMCIYIIVNTIDGIFMFLPIKIAVIISFINGMCGVTSYTIRISSTQNYVPDEKKGRFNGIFLLLTTVGSLLGQIISGALGEIMDARLAHLAISVIALAMALVLIGGNRKEVEKIYNTDN